MAEPLKFPAPYFGGKSKIAPQVWERIGAGVPNLVEPFVGSGAFLLARPGGKPRGCVETVNDASGYLSNVFRALQADPDAVARHADRPVNERDLEAIHWWLLTEGAARLVPLAGDFRAFDAEVAGLWIAGACCWIGGGWCSGEGPWQWTGSEWAKRDSASQLPHVGDPGMGINRQLPHVGDPGMGINRQLPHVGNPGMGINRQLPHVGDPGMGGERTEFIRAWFTRLSARLRDVRVACGDWSRVMGDSVTFRHGLTGVFLDPPYHGAGVEWQHDGYAPDASGADVWADVTAWCRENGNNPLLRIALCGYEGSPGVPEGWEAMAWKSHGGYGSQGDGAGRANAMREVVWLSPACLEPQGRLL